MSSSSINLRDQSHLHNLMCVKRKVPVEVLTEWEALNEQMDLTRNVPYPPPWAFDYFGGKLRETPLMPNQIGFYASEIDPTDFEELRILLLPTYEPTATNSE